MWARYPESEDLANLDDVEVCCGSVVLDKQRLLWNLLGKHNNFDGQVPKTHKVEDLPGVGHEKQLMVLAEVYGIPSIAVNTHVSRVSKG